MLAGLRSMPANSEPRRSGHETVEGRNRPPAEQEDNQAAVEVRAREDKTARCRARAVGPSEGCLTDGGARCRPSEPPGLVACKPSGLLRRVAAARAGESPRRQGEGIKPKSHLAGYRLSALAAGAYSDAPRGRPWRTVGRRRGRCRL